MKNFFGIEVTQDKNNLTFDGNKFLTGKIDDSLSKMIDETTLKFKDLQKKMSLPMFLNVIYISSVLLFVLFFSIFFRLVLVESLTFKEIYHKAPYLLYLILFFLIVFIILVVIKRKRFKSIVKKDEFTKLTKAFQEVIDLAKVQLGIPQDTFEIDVLSFKYIIDKKGKRRVRNGAMNLFDFNNLAVNVFVKNDCLCFYDLKSCYEVPLTFFKEIKKVKKLCVLTSWNKDEPVNSKKYKTYKTYQNSNGMIMCRYYYSLTIQDNQEEFELYIPPYDIEIISQWIHLPFES